MCLPSTYLLWKTMNIRHIALKAVATASLAAWCGFAAAADSQTAVVTASVTAVCKFFSAPVTIDFGAIDPSAAAGAKTAAVALPYRCTKGQAAPTVAVGTIVPLTNGAATMAFTLGSFTTAAGTGFSGAALSATSTASIASAQWQDAIAGSYSGSVVLTISP